MNSCRTPPQKGRAARLWAVSQCGVHLRKSFSIGIARAGPGLGLVLFSWPWANHFTFSLAKLTNVTHFQLATATRSFTP